MLKIKVRLADIVMSIANAIDTISPKISSHHKNVAYIAWNIANMMGLTANEKTHIVTSALIHDIGCLSLEDRIDTLDFEMKNSMHHSIAGYLLLKEFGPLEIAADTVRFHHTHWNHGKGVESDGLKVPIEAHVIHLADRIEVLINKNKNILAQETDIYKTIQEESGTMFHPEAVDALCKLRSIEHFWLYLDPLYINYKLDEYLESSPTVLTTEDLLNFSKMFGQIIDFKSRFTATHTTGVTATALAIAKLMSLNEDTIKKIEIACNLHDIGKLAVPKEILEKPAKLDFDEFCIVRTHTFYTYNILRPIKGFEEISKLAAYHHERLEGDGYPFHVAKKELSMGAKIVTIADIFTAITEDRPYREGMKKNEVIKTFKDFEDLHSVDPSILGVLEENYEELNGARKNAQSIAKENYSQFRENMLEMAGVAAANG